MNRRHFLQTVLASTGLLTGCPQLFAAPATDSRFLLVFLRCGYDAANIVIPFTSPFYYEARPSLAIAKPEPNNQQAALPLNTDWGLHPALKDSVLPMFQQKQLIFIPFAGTEDVSRSHFETQDSIELGQPLGGHRDLNSGFLNRLVSVLTGSHAIAFTDNLPLICKGHADIPNFSLTKNGQRFLQDRQMAIISEMYQGRGNWSHYVQEGLSLQAEVGQDMAAEEMAQASRGAIPAKGFELQARRMAKLMREKFNIGFVDIGGWDTHLNEGAADGQLANKIANLGNGLAVFAKEMGTMWAKTVVLVISEFGRTFRENGNRGTDHGHGTVYWVLGGSIKGQQILGEQTTVTQKNLFEDRDYPVLNNYRDLIGGLFQAQFGLSATQVQTLFAGANPTKLPWL